MTKQELLGAVQEITLSMGKIIISHMDKKFDSVNENIEISEEDVKTIVDNIKEELGLNESENSTTENNN
jgi:uncharacterized membrane protein